MWRLLIWGRCMQGIILICSNSWLFYLHDFTLWLKAKSLSCSILFVSTLNTKKISSKKPWYKIYLPVSTHQSILAFWWAWHVWRERKEEGKNGGRIIHTRNLLFALQKTCQGCLASFAEITYFLSDWMKEEESSVLSSLFVYSLPCPLVQPAPTESWCPLNFAPLMKRPTTLRTHLILFCGLQQLRQRYIMNKEMSKELLTLSLFVLFVITRRNEW